MLFYIGLFVSFLYFKIARVHKKEEKLGVLVGAQHAIVASSALALLAFGFMNLEWYIVLGSAFVFFIVAALMITAVQIGIFFDGKPVFGLSHVYKATPLMSALLLFSTFSVWMS